jgi:hypothetical protein
MRPIFRLTLVITIFIIIPFLGGIFFGKSPSHIIYITFVTFIILNLVFEILFRFFFKILNESSYIPKKRIAFDELYIEPHPYLPYVYKKNFKGPKSSRLKYPLCTDYYSAELKSNNIRFYDGSNGDREVVIPKPKGLIRIICMGSSTTGNYISENNKNYSYPIELEKELKKKYKKNIEVNNCAMGGYNSAELIVQFILNIIDTKPDYLIITPGFTDIKSYFTPNYDSDYSHSRKNLAEIYWRILVQSKIPKPPLQYIDFIINEWFPEFNMRNNVLDAVSKGGLDVKIKPEKGLEIFRRNLKIIVDLCKTNDIELVLCTYCMYLYDEIKNDQISSLYYKTVLKENKIIKNLAIENNLLLIDNASLMPKENSNFVDSIHYTIKGMKTFAKIISDQLVIK